MIYSVKGLFIFFLIPALASVVLVQTSFVPDEYWQSLEVAHQLVFGFGKISWEWREGIRSCAYPLAIAILYKVLVLMSFDYTWFLVYLPRIGQAVLSAVGNVCTCKVASSLYGRSVIPWTAAVIASSWFLFYCCSRTLYNSVETSLAMIALSFCTPNVRMVDDLRFLSVVCVSALIRPTSIIVFVPVCAWHITSAWKYSVKDFVERVTLYTIVGIGTLCIQMILDQFCYNRWLLTPYNFFHFNILTKHSDHYGRHPWNWYLIQGLPVVLTTHLLPLSIAVWQRKYIPLTALSAWIVAIYSCIGHKEFRFILTVVPLAMCIVGSYLNDLHKNMRTFCKCRPSWLVIGLFLTNIPSALYFGLVHQRGTIDIMTHIGELSKTMPTMHCLFLMPCHSTPAYSHIHVNMTLEFLSCDPNLYGITEYVDEADLFYQDPMKWLDTRYESIQLTGTKVEQQLPSHIVLFDKLYPTLRPFFYQNGYNLCAEFFHSHFNDGRVGNTVQIYCLN